MNWKVGSKSCIWLLWVTANMWKLNFPKLHVTGAYPVNLFSLNGYNFSSLVSRTSILQVQLIFSLVQLFFSEGQLMYLENKSCTTEKKSCTRENKSCTWSIIVLLNGAQKLYQLGENKFTNRHLLTPLSNSLHLSFRFGWWQFRWSISNQVVQVNWLKWRCSRAIA